MMTKENLHPDQCCEHYRTEDHLNIWPSSAGECAGVTYELPWPQKVSTYSDRGSGAWSLGIWRISMQPLIFPEYVLEVTPVKFVISV